MPPSSKRSQRARHNREPSPNPTVAEQSSPSRPTKRRRKADEFSSEAMEVEGTKPPKLDTDAMVTQVAQHLRSIPTHAGRDHANAKVDSTDDIEAYAKISAQDWTYYIRTLSINIGRTSEPPAPKPTDPEDKDFVHIDLGPSKTFSRQTALIYFDSDPGKWYIQAKGRNGLKVDNEPLKKSDPPHPLVSGEVIEIGGLEMMFILPESLGHLHINPLYLEQAGLPAPDADTHAGLPSLPSGDATASQGAAASRGPSFQQPIAPAPPDYKRPGTPLSAKQRPAAAQAKTPAQASSGTMMLNQNDVDLSHEDNKHIKPAFSYAQMITQAIISTPEEKLNLSGIYQYITDHYAYYRYQTPSGWQNSIRHNLSLNKAFGKAPRQSDEPGKGMKWKLEEGREEMIKNAYKGGRGGHRGSSAPSSPSQPSQAANVKAASKDLPGKELNSARKRKVSPVTSPPRSSLNISHVTPDRRLLTGGPASIIDGSPLPRLGKRPPTSNSFDPELPRSPPALSSSLLPDNELVTPAPLRVHPQLAPPSTAQRPSQHMPTSSPAPFWKYADINSTPMRPDQYDMSPLKPVKLKLPHGSSPPAAAGTAAPDEPSPTPSPSRSTRADTQEAPASMNDDEEEGGWDLTQYGAPSLPPPNISDYHQPSSFGGGLVTQRGERA
ncbi:fork head domain-containing protein [Xylariomycetidae sp. FL0641]|nr:fork head domain-containing protein [Xylariomycetidae sp. FL0641]